MLGMMSSVGTPSFGGVPNQQPMGGYQQRFPPPPQSSAQPPPSPPPSGGNFTLVYFHCYCTWFSVTT